MSETNTILDYPLGLLLLFLLCATFLLLLPIMLALKFNANKVKTNLLTFQK